MEEEKPSFEEELTILINTYGKESESSTPDYILAQYINSCLDSFNRATKERDTWHGFNSNPLT